VVEIWYPEVAACVSGAVDHQAADKATDKDATTPPCRAAGFPVLLYFSSWSGTTIDNRLLIEDLASRGFVVAAIRYPARTPGLGDEEFRRLQSALEQPMDLSSEDAFQAFMQHADARVRTRAEDASQVLDALTHLAQGTSPLSPTHTSAEPATDSLPSPPTTDWTQRLNLEHVGIFGFSLGGAVAAQAAWRDQRFQAVINIDGWHFADAAISGVKAPYLLISDGSPLPTATDLVARDPQRRYSSQLTDKDYRNSLSNLQRNGGFYLTINNTHHESLTDAAIQMPVRVLRRPFNPGRGLQVLHAYVDAFFDATLQADSQTKPGIAEPVAQDRKANLFDPGNTQFPEARLRVWAHAPIPVNARPMH
jgi:dienelactone hydrolase